MLCLMTTLSPARRLSAAVGQPLGSFFRCPHASSQVTTHKQFRHGLIGMCLLFAYGVAFLLAYCGRRGIWRGIVISTLFWGAIATLGMIAATQTQIAKDLLRMELLYTFLASIVVGTIIGGLTGRLVLSSAEDKLERTRENAPRSPLNLEGR